MNWRYLVHICASIVFMSCPLVLSVRGQTATAGVEGIVNAGSWFDPGCGGSTCSPNGAGGDNCQECTSCGCVTTPPGGSCGSLHSWGTDSSGNITYDSYGPCTQISTWTPGTDTVDTYDGMYNVTNSGSSIVTLHISGNNATQGFFSGGTLLTGGLVVQNFASFSNTDYAWTLEVTDALGVKTYGLNYAPVLTGLNYDYDVEILISGNASFHIMAAGPVGISAAQVISDGNPSMTIVQSAIRPAVVVSGVLTTKDPATDAPQAIFQSGSSVKLEWTVVYN